MKGRIVDVEFKAVNAVYLMQGIKRKDQWKYDGYLPGGNGTYVTGGEYSSSIIFKIYVYDLEHCISIDVKDDFSFVDTLGKLICNRDFSLSYDKFSKIFNDNILYFSYYKPNIYNQPDNYSFPIKIEYE